MTQETKTIYGMPEGFSEQKADQLLEQFKGKTVKAHTLLTAEENKTVWNDGCPVAFTAGNKMVTYFGRDADVPVGMQAYRDSQGQILKSTVVGG